MNGHIATSRRIQLDNAWFASLHSDMHANLNEVVNSTVLVAETE